MSRPLVLGAGPAGSMAAMLLARGGAEPILIDRDAEVGDALCGGFMSWRTAARLRNAGLELADLGAQRVTRLVLYAGRREAHAQLPEQGYGLSRHALDKKMRAMAVEAGAQLEIDRAREVSCSGIGGVIVGERQDWRSNTIFLASGKHDVRRLSRPRVDDDSALGIRMRIPGNAELAQLVGDAIAAITHGRGEGGRGECGRGEGGEGASASGREGGDGIGEGGHRRGRGA